MSARLDGNTVLVGEPLAARLHNRHLVGDLGPKGLRLSLVEAAWCLMGGRITMQGVDSVGDLLARGDAQTEADHLVYSDLRERGLVVRHAGPTLAVLPRGAAAGAPPTYAVRAFGERTPVQVSDLLQPTGTVLAVADDDGAVTHYRIEAAAPEGKHPPGPLPKAAGRMLKDRILVEDAGVRASWAAEGIGVPHGEGLVVSAVEAEHLRRRGVLSGVAVSRSGLDLLVAAHEAIRSRGALCKSGFKFGTHFRAYRDDPDDAHAEWLIQAVAADEELAWSDLSRAIRLAHGVRKTFLLAVVGKGPVRFVSLSWFRP